MTILEILSISTSLLLIPTCWWLLFMLREKDLLIDKLIEIINSETGYRITSTPYLIDRLEKNIKNK